MSEARVAYTPRANASTPEYEIDVFASIYRRAIETYEVRKAAHPGGPDDAKERPKNDSRAKPIIPK